MFLDFHNENYGSHTIYVTGSKEPGQVTDVGDVLLRDGMSLHGRVVDWEGEPIADAALELAPTLLESRTGVEHDPSWKSFDDRWRSAVFLTRTDLEGRFRFEALPSNSVPQEVLEQKGPFQLKVTAGGYSAFRSDLHLPEPGTELLIELESVGGLSAFLVNVRNEWGWELSRATIDLSLEGDDSWVQSPRLGKTDAAGVFRTRFFELGEASLGVSLKGYKSHRETVDLSGRRVVEVELQGARNIAGKVMDAASDGKVRLSFVAAPDEVLRRTESSGNGSFQFKGIPPGEYFVWATDSFGDVVAQQEFTLRDRDATGVRGATFGGLELREVCLGGG